MKAMWFGLGLALLSASAAEAIDCTKAATDVDTAICNSPAAIAADTAMGAAYTAALKLENPADARSLKADQANWLDLRRDCLFVVNDGGTGAHATAAQAGQCLATNADARAAYLSGTPAAGPGAAGRLVPVVFFGIDEIFNHTLRFAKPANAGEKAFNAALDADLEDIFVAKTASQTSDSFELSLAYASPALLSASIDVYQDASRFAHEMPYNSTINIDMANGKRLAMADMLDGAQLKPLVFYCDGQFDAYIAPDQDGADMRRDNVDNAVANLDFWTFGATAATVRYLDYDTQDAPPACTIGYHLLRPLVKPGFPLPN